MNQLLPTTKPDLAIKAGPLLKYKLRGKCPLVLEIAPLVNGSLPPEIIPLFQKLYFRTEEIAVK